VPYGAGQRGTAQATQQCGRAGHLRHALPQARRGRGRHRRVQRFGTVHDGTDAKPNLRHPGVMCGGARDLLRHAVDAAA